MARALLNARVWMDTVELTGALNAVALEAARDLLDETTFADTSRKRALGLSAGRLQVEGYALATTLDEVPPDSIGRSGGRIITVGSVGTEGAVAYTMKADAAQFTEGGSIGDLHGYSLASEVNGPLVRGIIGARRNTGGSSGNTGGNELGAVASGQRVYAAIHVLGASGASPEIVIAVQSDSDNTFASPTARITSDTITTPNAFFLSAAGAITDTWWRVAWTIGGTTTDFDITVAIGIL